MWYIRLSESIIPNHIFIMYFVYEFIIFHLANYATVSLETQSEAGMI